MYMLRLNNIKKVYEVESFRQVALDDVTLNFRQNEFVSILGPSGSGKTTLLNIIGGLDKYTSGDLIINDVSRSDTGFSSDDNAVTILIPGRLPETLSKASKIDIARAIMTQVITLK